MPKIAEAATKQRVWLKIKMSIRWQCGGSHSQLFHCTQCTYYCMGLGLSYPGCMHRKRVSNKFVFRFSPSAAHKVAFCANITATRTLTHTQTRTTTTTSKNQNDEVVRTVVACDVWIMCKISDRTWQKRATESSSSSNGSRKKIEKHVDQKLSWCKTWYEIRGVMLLLLYGQKPKNQNMCNTNKLLICLLTIHEAQDLFFIFDFSLYRNNNENTHQHTNSWCL